MTPKARIGFLSPSRLVDISNCPLKHHYSLPPGGSDGLPESPQMLLGSAIHEAIECVARNEIDSKPSNLRIWVAQHVWANLEKANTPAVVLKNAGVKPGKSNFVEPKIFSQRILGLANAIKSLPASGNNASSNGWTRTSSKPAQSSPKKEGFEVVLQSNSGSLKGRADLVERLNSDAFRITEFKSMPILGSDGTPSASCLMQMYAYGYMLSEAYPQHTIQLRAVGADGIWESIYDSKCRQELLELIESIMDRFKEAGEADIGLLASPGKGCQYCQDRPRCSEYKKAVQQQSLSEAINDTWGVICKITPGRTGLIDIDLSDYLNRDVRVANIPIELMGSDIKPGQYIEAFSLVNSEYGRGSSQSQNFSVVNKRLPYRSACTVKIKLA